MTTYIFSSGAQIDLTKAEMLSATGEVFSLGHKESELLKLLLVNSPEVVSKNIITEKVWQRPSISESAISVAIAKLRKQLNNAQITEVEIITAKGVGYRATCQALTQPTKPLDDITQRGGTENEHIKSADISSEPFDGKITNNPVKSVENVQLPTSTPIVKSEDSNSHSTLLSFIDNIGNKKIWAATLVIFSLTILLTLNWLYTFTECHTSFIPAEGSNHARYVQICWSENSQQAVLDQFENSFKSETAVVLVDKENRIKQYNKQGEVQQDAKE